MPPKGTAPKAPEAPAVDLDPYFDRLQTSIQNQQHKKVLKTTEEILAIAPGDEDALVCRIIAFIQLSEFEGALQLLSGPLGQKMLIEKAYCMYRLGKLQEALVALKSPADEQLEAALQLRAQLYYRLGDNKACIHCYDQLFQQHKVDSLELKTNVLAAYVAAQLASEIPDLMAAMKVNAKHSFELGFNKACGLVKTGNLTAAETELRAAIKQGRETLFGEDCSEEQVEDELSPLTVQLAYVLSRQGRSQEALELYEAVVGGGTTDETTKAVATNNLVAENNRGEALWSGAATQAAKKFAANSLKKLEILVDKADPLQLLSALETRLAANQKLAIHFNRALLQVANGRPDQARTLATSLAATYPDAPLAAVLKASMLARDGKSAEADSYLASWCSAHPDDSLQPLLMRAQLALEANNPQPTLALGLLGSVKDMSRVSSGGFIATRVALLDETGDAAGAAALLDQALAYWQAQPGSAPGRDAALGWLLQRCAAIRLKAGQCDSAVDAYSSMRKLGVTTPAAADVLSRLAWSASSTTDPVMRQRVLDALAEDVAGAIDESAEVDVEEAEEQALRLSATAAAVPGTAASREAALEAAAAAAAASSRKRGAESASEAMEVDGAAAGTAVKKRSKKRRQKRLPKDYDPTKPNGGLPLPDPERWMPKWQRSDYKKKMKRRRDKDVVKGSQGAGKVDDNLDRSKAAPVEKPEPKTSAPMLPPRKGKGKR